MFAQFAAYGAAALAATFALAAGLWSLDRA